MATAVVAACLPAGTPAQAVWAPRITSMTPALGPTDGWTYMTIWGSGLLGAVQVTFDGVPTAAVALSDSQLVLTTPPALKDGIVQVRVSTPVATSPDAGSKDDFRYFLKPKVTGVSPDDGLDTGGGTLSITGLDFTGATAVHVGKAPTTFTVNSPSSITAALPPKAPGDPGIVDVRVYNQWTSGGAYLFNWQDDFHYYSIPKIDNVLPREGPSSGGFQVRIIGTGFTDATTVYFGDVAVDARVDPDGKQIIVSAPAYGVGRVGITVENPFASSTPRSDDKDTLGFFDPSTVEDLLLAKIDDHRARNGKNRLSYSSVLADSARQWSEQMATDGVNHDSSNWCPSPFKACGELVQGELYDGYPTAAAYVDHLFQEFKSSVDHNSIMLGRFSHGGAGFRFESGFGYITVRVGQT